MIDINESFKEVENFLLKQGFSEGTSGVLLKGTELGKGIYGFYDLHLLVEQFPKADDITLSVMFSVDLGRANYSVDATQRAFDKYVKEKTKENFNSIMIELKNRVLSSYKPRAEYTFIDTGFYLDNTQDRAKLSMQIEGDNKLDVLRTFLRKDFKHVVDTVVKMVKHIDDEFKPVIVKKKASPRIAYSRKLRR